MPATEHVEKHFTSTAFVRDIVIGMSDGLTVPFALAAGLTGAVAASVKGTGIIAAILTSDACHCTLALVILSFRHNSKLASSAVRDRVTNILAALDAATEPKIRTFPATICITSSAT